MDEGFGLGEVALEHFVRQWQSSLIEGHTDSYLSAVAAFLFVVAMAGLGVLLAEALEMAVGDVVKNDAAAALEQPGLGVAQGRFDGLALGEEGVAGVIESVFGGLGDADAEQFWQGGALGPVDERPLTDWLNEAVGDEELGGGGLGRVQAAIAQDFIEAECPRQAARATSCGPSWTTFSVAMRSTSTPSTVSVRVGRAALERAMIWRMWVTHCAASVESSSSNGLPCPRRRSSTARAMDFSSEWECLHRQGRRLRAAWAGPRRCGRIRQVGPSGCP